MILKVRVIYLFFIDLFIITLSIASQFLLFYSIYGIISDLELITTIFIYVPVTLFFFYLFGMYKSLWRYASIKEFFNIVIGVLLSGLILIFLNYLHKFNSLSIIYNILIFNTLLVMQIGFRYSYRLYRYYKINISKRLKIYKRTLIVGAGDAGFLVLNEIRKNMNLKNRPVGFIDDDINKINKNIQGLPIYGQINNISKVIKNHKIEEVIIAILNISNRRKKEIINTLLNEDVKIKMISGIKEFKDNKYIPEIKDIDVEDLLGREPVELDETWVRNFLNGKRVLVTGAGGSIGSELCKNIIKYNPKELIMIDIYENNIYELNYDLNKEIHSKNIDTKLSILIDSIRDKKQMLKIFDNYRPNVVFHAAAHKHVPLMEINPNAAIKNNILGTFNLVDAADKFNVEKFVLISTDKAVNPTNVMGATKRCAELIIQAYNHDSKTSFSAVRFGNVLGSNGSVVQLFKKQIEAGGPVTVTHPDIARYFMTIPEACQLVLQSGAFAKGGELFVLDMGEQVKIFDLAEKMITLCGLKPNIDIDIIFTGLRKGEKMYEELFINPNNLKKTKNKKISIEHINYISKDSIIKIMSEIELLLDTNNSDLIKDYLFKII